MKAIHILSRAQDAIARMGAVPKLAELLKNTSDIAQENAAGRAWEES